MDGQADTFRTQIIAIIGSFVVLFAILELVRRRKLREEYSFVWIAAAVVLMFFSIRRDLFERLAWMLGIDYPPSLLVLGIIVLGLIVSVHFSVKISLLERQVTRLAQELGIASKRTKETSSIQVKHGESGQISDSTGATSDTDYS